MDVAFDHIVAHQPVNDIGAFPVSRADHQGMPQEVALIHKRVGTDTLPLPKILERAAGMEGLATHLELLAIAGSMEPARLTPVAVGQFHRVHRLEYPVIGGADVFQRKAPIDHVLQLVFRQARRNPCHFADTDPTAKPHDASQQHRP